MGEDKEEIVIETQNLSKHFGSIKAVIDVSLTVRKGETYALIGPNGAGKSTLIKVLVGLLSPTSGRALVFGNDIVKQPEETKRMFGYISDDPTAYGFLTGAEFLALTGNLRGITSHDIKKRVHELRNLFPLGDIIHTRMGNYSRGNRQKIAILTSMLSEPNLLIIDEPIVGLDPASIEILGTTLNSFTKKGGTIFLATHILAFAEKYADRVGVMDKGKIVHEEKITSSTSLENIYQKAQSLS